MTLDGGSPVAPSLKKDGLFGAKVWPILVEIGANSLYGGALELIVRARGFTLYWALISANMVTDLR